MLSNYLGHLCLNSNVISCVNHMYFSVQFWLILGPMSWTLARHCKVTVDKTSRCRGRVFGTYTTLVLSCMSYVSFEIYLSTQSLNCFINIIVINYVFTQVTLFVRCWGNVGQVSTHWVNIVQIICKYRLIVPTNTRN